MSREYLELCIKVQGLPEDEKTRLLEQYANGETVVIGSSVFEPPKELKEAAATAAAAKGKKAKE